MDFPVIAMRDVAETLRRSGKRVEAAEVTGDAGHLDGVPDMAPHGGRIRAFLARRRAGPAEAVRAPSGRSGQAASQAWLAGATRASASVRAERSKGLSSTVTGALASARSMGPMPGGR